MGIRAANSVWVLHSMVTGAFVFIHVPPDSCLSNYTLSELSASVLSTISHCAPLGKKPKLFLQLCLIPIAFKHAFKILKLVGILKKNSSE